MEEYTYSEKVDELIKNFWKNGYLTLSRKFGTYLPEPPSIGKYEIDALGKYKKNKYAIGITLSEEDFKSDELADKIKFLATRQTKYSKKGVVLFVAVPEELFLQAKFIINSFDQSVKKNIKLFPITAKKIN